MSKRAPRPGLGPPVPPRIKLVPQGRPGGPDTRRRALIAAAVVGIAVAAGGAVAALDPFRATAATHSDVSRGADPPSLATIRQGSLSSQISQSGALDYANPETVYGLLSGTITSLPSVGQVIKPGQTLYKVDNKPVVLFKGNVPAYRDLGLSIVHAIATAHGATLTARAQPHGGLWIEITFPATMPQADQHVAPAARPPSEHRPHAIDGEAPSATTETANR